MKKEVEHDSEHSLLIPLFSRFIEWGNENFTLSRWLFRKSKKIFVKLELMMVAVAIICFGILLTIRFFPFWLGLLISILLIQRVIEFFIVYTRNFIFNRGRIFSHFDSSEKRGEWLITVFGLNVLQVIFIFAIWYQMISSVDFGAFSHQLFAIDSLYFSFTTFVTVGYGDIFPISVLARVVTMAQMALTFYTLVIVVNGLIALHFSKK